jgi:hypothetical protein
MRFGFVFLATLAIVGSAYAANTLTDTARFRTAFQGSFYGFDVCGDAANGRLYRKALIDRVEHCPFTKDAKADFSQWAATAESQGSVDVQRYLAEHDKLPPRLDRRKTACIAEQQNAAYQQALAMLSKYAAGQTKADAVVPDACDAANPPPVTKDKR